MKSCEQAVRTPKAEILQFILKMKKQDKTFNCFTLNLQNISRFKKNRDKR